MPSLSVHCLPELVQPAELAGGLAVVIDVLRATTTAVAALEAGAAKILPCLTVADAEALHATQPPKSALLCGERGGLKIAGFDLGNSPAEYTPARVGGKMLVFTTTNGTKALLHCREAAEIVLAAFANLSAIVGHCRSASRVDLVCSGTDGQVTREDVLLAGAITAELTREPSVRDSTWLNDQAALARDAWLHLACAGPQDAIATRLTAAFAESQGGRNLIEVGHGDDLAWAAQIDRVRLLPRYDAAQGSVQSRRCG